MTGVINSFSSNRESSFAQLTPAETPPMVRVFSSIFRVWEVSLVGFTSTISQSEAGLA